VDRTESFWARRDGEEHGEASKKERIQELEQRSVLHGGRLNPFLVTQNNDFNFGQVFRRLMGSAEEGRFQIGHLENLFRKHISRVRRRKYKMEEGVQATSGAANGSPLLVRADLTLDKSPRGLTGKSAFHSQGFLADASKPFDGFKSDVYAKKSHWGAKESCQMIEEDLQEDDCEDNSRENINVSFDEAEAKDAFDRSAYDQFASKEVRMRHIRLHRRDLLPPASNLGDSGSSHSSVPEM